MKDGAGFYTGELKSYGILDDSEKSKDFYLVSAHFKQDRSGSYTPLKCDGLLLNFEDVLSIQVARFETDEKRQSVGVPQAVRGSDSVEVRSP